MPDVNLTFYEMEPFSRNQNFKIPSAPALQKQASNSNWLHEDHSMFNSDAISLYSSAPIQLSDVIDGGFRDLHGRIESTSTPFIKRTLDISSSGVTHNDSGIDVSFCSGISTNSTDNSFLLSNSDCCGHAPFIGPLFLEDQVLSKYSDTDSVFGDISTTGYDSASSNYLSPNILPVPIKECQTSVKKKVQVQRTPLLQHDSISPCDAPLANSFSARDAFCTNIPLMAPSWCSPLPVQTSRPDSASTPTFPPPHIQDNIVKLLKQFSPSEPDRLIGRKMGLDTVDIISELYIRRICVLKLIFQYLDVADLCRASCVSHRWRAAISSNPVILKRKTAFVKNLKRPHEKENCRKTSQLKSHRGMTDGSTLLGTIQSVAVNKPTSPADVKSSAQRHTLFWQEASKCKDGESIRKCPRCTNPARVHNVQERAWCSNTKCKFDFCIRCNSAFHGVRDCSISPVKKPKPQNCIGSKKSKRNLKRL